MKTHVIEIINVHGETLAFGSLNQAGRHTFREMLMYSKFSVLFFTNHWLCVEFPWETSNGPQRRFKMNFETGLVTFLPLIGL